MIVTKSSGVESMIASAYGWERPLRRDPSRPSLATTRESRRCSRERERDLLGLGAPAPALRRQEHGEQGGDRDDGREEGDEDAGCRARWTVVRGHARPRMLRRDDSKAAPAASALVAQRCTPHARGVTRPAAARVSDPLGGDDGLFDPRDFVPLPGLLAVAASQASDEAHVARTSRSSSRSCSARPSGCCGRSASALKPLGTGFVALVQVMIAPIIFCTIVVGVGSIAKAATVGKIGGLALLYFMVMSTFALAIGLVVGNILHPGEGLNMAGATYEATAEAKTHRASSSSASSRTTFFSAFTGESVLQVLFVALLVGFALQQMGPKGQPIMNAVKQPAGAGVPHPGHDPVAGAARRVRRHRRGGRRHRDRGDLESRPASCVAFYITCIAVRRRDPRHAALCGHPRDIFSLVKYLAREYLLIVGTSSSESALPRLIAKMEHLGVSKPVVGITVPTGYSFNLDGTAIYLTMASLFIASGMGAPMSIPEQIGLLVFMIIASKGAAGVTGAGLATLAGGLQAYRPDLVNGVGVIVGIDRFMSEGRALTNFTGNAVATVLIGSWTKEFDADRARRVLAGELPFDENTLSGADHDGMSESPDAVGIQGLEEAAVAEADAKAQRARDREAQLAR